MKVKAFAYLRVSGKGQVEGTGFDRQMDEIRRYAEKHGYEIVATFREEGISGTTDEMDRPAFQSLVSEILKDSVRVVIVEGLDRLAREYRIQESLLIYLASKDITLISARTGENVTDAMLADPMKKALIQMQGIFSELEKSLLVKKLRIAREKVKAKTGKCEGQRGYKEIEGGPELVKQIRRLRRLPFKGASKKRSFQEIADILNTEGKTTKNGKLFTAQNVANIYERSSK
ncbi:MAG: resolvase [Deltaproteobacteria bacterium HGW-Deltaproteobacteria-21]|nr:MAG: resolvase [Deltaproteobacteria bacterium HGW-Deltaproteobacteria-21]